MNTFTRCYLVVVHLFPLYFTGNTLIHPSECTILKVFFLIDLSDHAPGLAV